MWPIADVGDVAQLNRSFEDHRIHTPHAKGTIASFAREAVIQSCLPVNTFR
jgi:hypothetical protein